MARPDTVIDYPDNCAACHERRPKKITQRLASAQALKIALVGSPNVGKSSVFHALTGRRVIISNYPGTTVDIFRGNAVFDGHPVEVIDTPGMYSLHSITEEERVGRAILLKEKPDVVLHVLDAKNLERMLPMTFQLIEAGLPLIVVLNMVDEAEAHGIVIDIKQLSSALGVPVLTTAASLGRGVPELKQAILDYKSQGFFQPIVYDETIENAIDSLIPLVKDSPPAERISARSVALLLLRQDEQIRRLVAGEGKDLSTVDMIVEKTTLGLSQPPAYLLALALQREATKLTSSVMTHRETPGIRFNERLSRAMMHPLSGGIILAVVLFAMYYIVGIFGAGFLVGWLEKALFGQIINPFFQNTLSTLIPVKAISDLFVGQYGIITLGLTYAIAIILPIVTTFFLVFSMIEDSGYLPRLAMLIDRLFKFIGLNGRAVIPMVLGFGCDTMATIVTRTQETKRERIITTLLLALAIPCSAQLGVIFGILSVSTGMLITWLGIIALIFVLVGWLASRIIPGERACFYMEVPPLRLPRLSNVLQKTYARLEWYLLEVIPIFILASVVLWAGDLIGLLDLLIKGLRPVVEFAGIPAAASVAFVIGFFRRDFGAAGLYALATQGILTGNALLVSAVVMTLFVPCIAQFSVMIKERGLKTALAIAGFIFPFAFLVGFVLNHALNLLGINL
ncbi:ferrous iron transport protein B [Dehalogenimonas etheniformans]|uniref:Ferrous iron transport protein B n=1 Tax=Dehalogenimonas etheniformans TaxID=1536648 RepID=A0A2P5P6Y7_9CHLR|nr:ferrous iron transport protein B [Dehalogenimonas etheniformans]PPD58071.1 ferrous iron transport protein B [Dehalogenimonas etheniformans]QNT75278.1 ferrous iron transport protein B [Dehalogenimonas etheniformans]